MTTSKNVLENYTGRNRRNNKVWDRRIPEMPTAFGTFLQFIFKTRRRFTVLLILACIGYIWLIADITILIYKHFYVKCP